MYLLNWTLLLSVYEESLRLLSSSRKTAFKTNFVISFRLHGFLQLVFNSFNFILEKNFRNTERKLQEFLMHKMNLMTTVLSFQWKWTLLTNFVPQNSKRRLAFFLFCQGDVKHLLGYFHFHWSSFHYAKGVVFPFQGLLLLIRLFIFSLLHTVSYKICRLK